MNYKIRRTVLLACSGRQHLSRIWRGQVRNKVIFLQSLRRRLSRAAVTARHILVQLAVIRYGTSTGRPNNLMDRNTYLIRKERKICCLFMVTYPAQCGTPLKDVWDGILAASLRRCHPSRQCESGSRACHTQELDDLSFPPMVKDITPYWRRSFYRGWAQGGIEKKPC